MTPDPLPPPPHGLRNIDPDACAHCGDVHARSELACRLDERWRDDPSTIRKERP